MSGLPAKKRTFNLCAASDIKFSVHHALSFYSPPRGLVLRSEEPHAFKIQIMRGSRQIVLDKDIHVLHDGNMNFHVAVRWLAVALWMGMIFAVSSIPSLASPLESFYDFIARKLAHMAEYGVLTVLLFRAVRIHTRRNARALLIAAVVAVLYALSDEWHQTFVPGREGSLRDVVVDALGVVGMSLWLIRSK